MATPSAAELRFQFEDLEKQTHAAQLGMWLFLASEVLFFAALFALFIAYRFEYGHVFEQAANYTDLGLGTADTFILLTSSFFVAISVYGAREGWSPTRLSVMLALPAALGAFFLVLKFLEYSHHFEDGIYPLPYYHFDKLPVHGAEIFFTLYYLMTGLHAGHVGFGVLLLSWLAWRASKGDFGRVYHTPLELGGMYWHFVDIVWLFLWPLFYLLRSH